jgi:CrcB protein
MAFPPFPYGTLAVNLLGCAAIGVLAGLGESRQLFSPELRGFVFVGLLGGFTTFSTFAHETTILLRHDAYLQAFTSVGLHVGLGLLLVWAGYAVATAR